MEPLRLDQSDIPKKSITNSVGVGKYENTTPIFKKLNLLKSVDIVKLKTVLIMHNIFHNKMPNNIQKQFQTTVRKYPTRHPTGCVANPVERSNHTAYP